MKKALLKFLAGCCLSLSCLLAQAGQLAIVVGGNESVYGEFLTTLKSGLQNTEWRVAWEGSAESFHQSPPTGVDLILAVGTPALRYTLLEPSGPPVMATMLSRASYEETRRYLPSHRTPVSAIYLDQPLSRLLALIKRVVPENRHVTSLLGNQTADLAPQLKRLAGATGFTSDIRLLPTGDQFVPTLEKMLEPDGAFLALPDTAVFARDNVRAFLLATYRYRRPVIAFSASFVQAGALAAVFTTPGQMGQEVVAWLQRTPRIGSSLPPPQSPSRFSIATNPQVARSLSLSLPDESELMAALAGRGGER